MPRSPHARAKRESGLHTPDLRPQARAKRESGLQTPDQRRPADAAAPVFAALGDPQRLTLVARLCREGPLSIARLAEGADISRQAVTKHLHVLADAGVIRGTREGRENVFEIEPRRLKAARGHLDRISAQWDAALDRLRKLVE